MNRGLVCALLGLLVLTSCATRQQNTSRLVQYTQPAEERNKYHPYLLRMSDDERARFFRLKTDHQRDLFLRAEGIVDKKFLYDNLQVGMTKPQVRKKLGPPNDSMVDFNDQGQETRWLFSRFNGIRYSQYALVFQNDKLRSWDVWVRD